jgi:hypothetical protein
MRVFTQTVKDSQSDLYVIANECSFNMACSYLEEQNKDNRFGKFIKTESMTTNLTKLIFEKRSFYYDEERGYLLSH